MSTERGSSETTLGRVVAGRYRLVSEVGRGGMGIVWLACDEVLGRDVALKRVGLLPGEDAPDLARAEREARLAAGLNHPHVVSVFDLAVDGDEQWLVMEYVAGRTLTQLVAQDGPLTPDHAARLLGQAAAALAAAHAAGVVHRDVKPSNILVTDEGVAKLTDFGIARGETDATLTRTGLMSGSPAYLSPEVASGRLSGPPADVWALGATMVHALTGRPPYESDGNVVAVLYRIVHEDPPRPAEAGWLDAVLDGALQRDPEARWTMAQVRDFLQQPPALRPAPPARTATQPIRPAPAPAPLPAAAKTTTDTQERSSRAPIVAGVLLVVLALGAVVWSALSDDDAGDARSPSGAGAGQNPSAEGPEEAPREEPDAVAQMEAFVEDYLATVTTDPRAAWTMLTPQFQDDSGGFQKYRGWWALVDSAEVLDVEASPADMTVRYTVRYQMADGTSRTEQIVLVLARDEAGDLLIAAEP